MQPGCSLRFQIVAAAAVPPPAHAANPDSSLLSPLGRRLQPAGTTARCQPCGIEHPGQHPRPGAPVLAGTGAPTAALATAAAACAQPHLAPPSSRDWCSGGVLHGRRSRHRLVEAPTRLLPRWRARSSPQRSRLLSPNLPAAAHLCQHLSAAERCQPPGRVHRWSGGVPASLLLALLPASVLAGLQQALTSAAAAAAAAGAPPPAGTACQLSSALSRALCFLNSQQRRAAAAVPGGAPFPEGSDAGGGGAGLGPQAQAARVLVLAAAPDVPSQYISVMNAIFQPKGHSSAQRARLCSVVRAACRPPGRWGALCVLRCVPHPAWQALPCGGCSAVLGACRARALQPAPLALQGSLHHPPSGRMHTFPSRTRAAPAAVCPQAVCPQAAHPPWIILPAAE